MGRQVIEQHLASAESHVREGQRRVEDQRSILAEFTVPKELVACGFGEAPGRYRLITLRSNDQFNTTIYGYSDRLRGIEGTRDVLLINREEMTRAGAGVDGEQRGACEKDRTSEPGRRTLQRAP